MQRPAGIVFDMEGVLRVRLEKQVADQAAEMAKRNDRIEALGQGQSPHDQGHLEGARHPHHHGDAHDLVVAVRTLVEPVVRAAHVAVKRAVAGSHFAFIARGKHQQRTAGDRYD